MRAGELIFCGGGGGEGLAEGEEGVFRIGHRWCSGFEGSNSESSVQVIWRDSIEKLGKGRVPSA
jgi:hypothetical protein